MTYDKQMIEEAHKRLRFRMIDCPMFLKMALQPIPSLLEGAIPFDRFLERQAKADTTWIYAKEDIKAILEDSYSQEGELLMSIYDKIVEIGDFRTEEAREQLREHCRLAMEAYLAKPVQERNQFLL